MMQRLGRFLSLMAKNGLDCVIVKDIPTIRYLSGFRGDSSLLYVDAKSTVLITDGRYTTQAEGEVQHYCRVFTYIRQQRILPRRIPKSVLTAQLTAITITRALKGQ